MNYEQLYTVNNKSVYKDTCIDIIKDIKKSTDKNQNNLNEISKIMENTSVKNKMLPIKYSNIVYKCKKYRSLIVLCCIIFSFIILLTFYGLFVFIYNKYYTECETTINFNEPISYML